MAQVHGKPSDVSAEGGGVIVDGPDGVAVTLTPDAAEVTADRLAGAATEARQQDDRGGAAPEADDLDE